MTKANLTVRRADANEYGRIGDITVAAYLALGDEMADADRAFYLDELRDVERRARSSEILVAVDEGNRIFGAVAFVADDKGEMAEWDEPGAAGFRMLAVDPSLQRVGCGRLLTDACVDRARNLGRSQIVLHSTSMMTVAHRLYESMGFVRYSKIDVDLGHTLLMGYRKDLSGAAV